MPLKQYFLRHFNKRRYFSGLQRHFLQNVVKGTCFGDAGQKRRIILLIAADLKTSPKPGFLVVTVNVL